MISRAIKSEDLEILRTWWHDHGWEPLPVEILSRTGIIAATSEKPIMAAFYYSTNSAIAILEWFISNKTATSDEKQEALSLIVRDAESEALKTGATALFCSINNKSLIQRLEKTGFISTDSNMTNMTKPVQRRS